MNPGSNNKEAPRELVLGASLEGSHGARPARRMLPRSPSLGIPDFDFPGTARRCSGAMTNRHCRRAADAFFRGTGGGYDFYTPPPTTQVVQVDHCPVKSYSGILSPSVIPRDVSRGNMDVPPGNHGVKLVHRDGRTTCCTEGCSLLRLWPLLVCSTLAPPPPG